MNKILTDRVPFIHLYKHVLISSRIDAIACHALLRHLIYNSWPLSWYKESYWNMLLIVRNIITMFYSVDMIT